MNEDVDVVRGLTLYLDDSKVSGDARKSIMEAHAALEDHSSKISDNRLVANGTIFCGVYECWLGKIH